MLTSLKMRTKLLLVTALTFIGLLLLMITAVTTLKSHMLEDRQDKIKTIIESAKKSALYYQTLISEGVMDEQEGKENYLHTLRGLNFDQGRGFIFGFDEKGLMLVHGHDKTMEGKNYLDDPNSKAGLLVKRFLDQAHSGGGFLRYDWWKPGHPKSEMFPKLSYVDRVPGWQFSIVTGLFVDDIDAKIESAVFNLIMMSVVIALAVMGLVWVLSRDITETTRHLSHCMTALASGHLDVQVKGVERGDELGDMAHAIETFRDQASQIQTLENAQSNLKQEATAKSQHHIDEIATDLDSHVKTMVGAMSHSIDSLHHVAGRLVEIANVTSEQSGAVAAATELTSRNVQTVTAAAEELAASSNDIALQAKRTTDIAHQASADADQANKTVEGLAEATRQIGEVVGLINDIASQTNLLALNATIEAARAGEAGKGFAVVASEVKNLANQTTRATDEIALQIQAVTTETGLAVNAIRGISSVITEVREATSSIAAAVEEQNAAIEDIARTVSDAQSGTQEVSGQITAVSSKAREILEATHEVRQSGDDLTQKSQELEETFSVFVTDLRQNVKSL